MTHFRDFHSSNQIHCGANGGDNLIKLRHLTYAKLTFFLEENFFVHLNTCYCCLGGINDSNFFIFSLSQVPQMAFLRSFLMQV